MKLVLDTNVLIAAFISHGTCHELFEYVIQHHTLITSQFIVDEFVGKMEQKFQFEPAAVQAATQLLHERMEVVTPEKFSTAISRDPDDDVVLGTAVAGRCDCLISGDNDLLDLQSYQDIPIIPPNAFWEFEAEFLT